MDKRKAPEVAVEYASFLRKINPSIKKVYLFGSYARGTANDNSDIDLAIIFDNLSDAFDMQVELMKMRRKFDTGVLIIGVGAAGIRAALAASAAGESVLVVAKGL